MTVNNKNNLIKIYRRNLPHFHPKAAIFFVNYRLHFTLPSKMRSAISGKKLALNKKVREKKLSVTNKDKLLFDYYDALLVKDTEVPQWLSNEKAALTVIDSLLYFHKKSYELICTTVMPNHVHTLIRTSENEFEENPGLQKIMARHKKFTAININKILGSKG